METFVDKENLDGDITFKCSLLGNYPSWTKPKLARISEKLWKSIVNKQFWSMFSCDWVQLKAFLFFFFPLEISGLFFCLFVFSQIEFPILLSVTTFTIFNVCITIQDIGGKRCMHVFLKLNHHNLKASKWKMSHVREKHTDRKGYNKWEDIVLLMIYVCPLPFL